MKIERVALSAPPPREYRMTFTSDEAWTLIGALRLWVDRYPGAAAREVTERWANDLDALVRR